MRSTASLFQRKQFAALLVVLSVFLAAYYFSNNLSKVRTALRFSYLLESEREAQKSGRGAGSVVEVTKSGRSLIRRHFYSPFCAALGYSLYALDCDLRDKGSLPAVRIYIDGHPRQFGRLFLFREFSICLDEVHLKAYAFIHSDSLSTLQKLRDNRESLIGYLSAEEPGPKGPLFVCAEESEMKYTGKGDGEWVEQIWKLPPIGVRSYEFRFQYRVAFSAQPFFIAGQEPDWFVHEKLPVGPGSEEYSSYRIVAAAPRKLEAPVLILRNWAGVGTAFFRNVKIRALDSHEQLGRVSYRETFDELGGVPEVVAFK